MLVIVVSSLLPAVGLFVGTTVVAGDNVVPASLLEITHKHNTKDTQNLNGKCVAPWSEAVFILILK